MKKQILILLVACMASITTVFAQVPPDLGGAPICPDPTPLAATCAGDDGLNPIPGKEYTYTVEVPSPTTGTKEFTWFVTTDQTFITASAISAAIEANDGTGPHIFQTGVGYNDPANATAAIDITWKYWTHDAANPVFLVIYVENDICPTDNIQVYIIIPKHSFTLDIANIGEDGSTQGDLFATCVAPVAGAQYVAGTIEMDYGINYMFFIVTAANFTHSWLPSFQTGGADLIDSRDVTAVDWATPANAVAGTWNAMTESSTNLWEGTTPVLASNSTVGAVGECIVVRITIENNQTATLITDDQISLAVDGVMYDPTATNYANTALGDLHFADCTLDGFTNDVATQVLSPRPEINAIDPTPFVPKNDD